MIFIIEVQAYYQHLVIFLQATAINLNLLKKDTRLQFPRCR